MRASRALVLVMFMGCPLAASAQDLFERARHSSDDAVIRSRTTYQGRDRVDLALSADLRSSSLVEDRGSGRIGVAAEFDSDFACGRFDVRANLKSLFSKNAREEFLGSAFGALESELLKNALVLVCEASPTLCQALQHYRISANAMLAMNYDRCRAVEQAVDLAMERAQAEAIKACIEEKRKAGKPLDEALEECKATEKVRSITGDRVTELDLIAELKKVLGLTREEDEVVQSLVSDRVKYTARSHSGEIARSAVEEEYRRIRARYESSWREGLEKSARNENLSDEVFLKLVPPASPRVSPAEFAEIALLRPALREVIIASVASQAALLELVRKAHEVERILETARRLPTAGGETVQRLEREKVDLRAEIARLTETHERQVGLNRSLLEGITVARRGVVQDAHSAVSQLVLDQRTRRIEEDTQKWGAGTPRLKSSQDSTSIAGPGCGDCAGVTWSFGSASGRNPK